MGEKILWHVYNGNIEETTRCPKGEEMKPILNVLKAISSYNLAALHLNTTCWQRQDEKKEKDLKCFISHKYAEMTVKEFRF